MLSGYPDGGFYMLSDMHMVDGKFSFKKAVLRMFDGATDTSTIPLYHALRDIDGVLGYVGGWCRTIQDDVFEARVATNVLYRSLADFDEPEEAVSAPEKKKRKKRPRQVIKLPACMRASNTDVYIGKVKYQLVKATRAYKKKK